MMLIGDGNISQLIAAEVAKLMPPFAATKPLSEAVGGSAGQMDAVPRADHQHPRLTSTGSGSLSASGEATITFTRTFATKPAVIITQVEAADTQPVVFKVKSWVQDAQSNYIGCVIKVTAARRSRPIS